MLCPWCSVCAGAAFVFVLLYALATCIFALLSRADDSNGGETLPGYVNAGLTASMVIGLSGGAISGTLLVWYCLVCETLRPGAEQPLSPYASPREPAAAAPAEGGVAP